MSDTPTPEVSEDATPTAEPAPEQVHGFTLVDSRGQPVVHVPREQYVALVKTLISDGYVQVTDLCGVDYLTHPGRDAARRRRRANGSRSWSTCSTSSTAGACACGSRSLPTTRRCPTLFDLHPGTEAMEREAYDMFGIEFTDHPDLTPHPDAGGLGGHPAAQGLRHRRDPGAVQHRLPRWPGRHRCCQESADEHRRPRREG